jgi:hypothetical protein
MEACLWLLPWAAPRITGDWTLKCLVRSKPQANRLNVGSEFVVFFPFLNCQMRCGACIVCLVSSMKYLLGREQVRFSCPGCCSVLSIADQNIPSIKDARLSCPKCKSMIELNVDRESEQGEVISSIQPAINDAIEYDTLEESAPILPFIPEGALNALVIVGGTTLLSTAKQILAELDFHVTVEQESRAALNRLNQISFDLVALEILDKDMAAESASFFMQEINILPIQVRRSFFLCLLSDVVATFDRVQAFRMGANLIINVRDLHKGKTILRQALREHRSFYQFFREELEKKGKL